MKKTKKERSPKAKRAVKAVFSVLCVILVLASGLLIFMSYPGDKDTPVNSTEGALNPYIKDYLDVDISAHRSGAGVAPENTLMAFQKMLEESEIHGVDTFEFDVNITKDGELVLLHDTTYDDTSNAREEFGRSNVESAELTLEEARVLNMDENFEIDGEYPYRGLRGDDIPDNLRIVTCDEIIDYIEANSNGRKFNYIIEIKPKHENGKKAADKLYEIIMERGIEDRVIWASAKADVSEYMASKYPDMPRSASRKEVFQFYYYFKTGKDLAELDVTYIALQIPYGKSSIQLFVNLGTRELINYAHKYDIAVQYWTVNKEKDVLTLAQNGADCIMTDYPQMAYEAVESLK